MRRGGCGEGAFGGCFEQQQALLLALRDQHAAALDRELERIANTSSLGVERDRAVSWWRFPPTHSSIRLVLTDGLTLHDRLTRVRFAGATLAWRSTGCSSAAKHGEERDVSDPTLPTVHQDAASASRVRNSTLITPAGDSDARGALPGPRAVRDWLVRTCPARWSDQLARSLVRGSGSLVALALLTGVGVGVGEVAFRYMILGFTRLFSGHRDYSAIGHASNPIVPGLGIWFVLFAPVIGGLIYGPLVARFAPEARGHGVPEVMLAVNRDGGRIRPQVSLVRSLASAICIGSGGSVGPEGPIVHIGSALGSLFGQLHRFV